MPSPSKRPTHRRETQILWVLAGLLSLSLALAAGTLFLRDYGLRLLPHLQGFTRRASFSILDSLPALSPGLSDLEAFTIHADPSLKTNADRSIWLGDSVGAVHLQYYTGSRVHDSTRLYVWMKETGVHQYTLTKDRHLVWTLPLEKRLENWSEVVSFYLSYPRKIKWISSDTSVEVFERAEGKTIHIVRRRYRNKRLRTIAPDTVYPIAMEGETSLLAKGRSLAIVNPGAKGFRIRILQSDKSPEVICEISANSVHIFRSLLHPESRWILASTMPGETYPPRPDSKSDTPLYFVLNRQP